MIKKYGYLWVTIGFFLITVIGHWFFAWSSYVDEQNEHESEIKFGDYMQQTARDTLENWQSEFLQLMWQVAGLSFLLYVGSPQSKEGDERKEEKLDAILKAVDMKSASKIIKELEKKYPKK